MSGGGVPTVSAARQTTTPPAWLNCASESQGVRSGAASSSRCGRPEPSATRLATCGSPATARSGWLVRRSKLSTKNGAIDRAGSEVATSLVPVHGTNSVVATTANAGTMIAASQTTRNMRWRRK